MMIIAKIWNYRLNFDVKNAGFTEIYFPLVFERFDFYFVGTVTIDIKVSFVVTLAVKKPICRPFFYITTHILSPLIVICFLIWPMIKTIKTSICLN